jgi:hypothetical protein
MQTNSKSRDICRQTFIVTKLDLLFNLAHTAIPGCSLAALNVDGGGIGGAKLMVAATW